MKRLRRVHLLMGSFVAPITIFFAATGVVQVFGFHRAPKDGSYKPPEAVNVASSVHRNEYFRAVPATPSECEGITDGLEQLRCRERVQERLAERVPARMFAWLMVFGAAGIALNAVTGVLMAVQLKAWRGYVVLLFALGLLAPVLLILL